ncbi:universal stress protein [Arsenicicoccus piscis]|uniref:UspA domain-containing protein n=1 Tax=Arsenicicoccus piscis TaxID=673954 RepID=A0ABQ6HR76_9MICO|nr:universal stress protein [Arsenicicoccus piscis]MCH8628885.1 universal stress protein [Arsenicicoccus piscis]GMA20055.1 hypothetical protein GCM10025862_20760 [Arsenicicoccus piscis]
MSVMVAVPDSAEGALALTSAIAEARLLGTDVLAVNLGLRPISPEHLMSGETRITILERTHHESHAEVVLHALAEHPETERLVIGVKRRSKVGKALIGSVSQTLLLEADVPILAVKLPH